MRFSILRATLTINQLIFTLTIGVISTAYAVDSAPNVMPATKIATSASISTPTKPLWVTLALEQKLALTPLAPEWDKMDEILKKKWLQIANKYASMKPDEQARVQERMQAWMKLTPEQRMQARENFVRTAQIKPEQKSAQWQQYQQLSEDQKKQLANEANKKKSVTNVPPESQRNVKPLAPIKTGPKPTSTSSPQKVQPVQPTATPANNIISTSASQPTIK